ncbi:MAG: ABC transporter permease [Kineosporiaceae bacterium]
MSVETSPTSGTGAPEPTIDVRDDAVGAGDPQDDRPEGVRDARTPADRTGSVTADLAAPAPAPQDPVVQRIWSSAWPKLLGLGIFLALWQLVVLTGWRPTYVLPEPTSVLERVWRLLTDDQKFWASLSTTLRRGLLGFALAIAVGSVLGVAVARFHVLRAGVGSLITGLQTMPSIVWFPLAILLFGLNEQAIMFVVVLGAAPSIANGLISGIDHVPPAFTRLGRVLGAKGWQQYRFVVLPAALPSYVAGLNQGWAFAWRSLMAGELLVILANRPSLGARLEFAREFGDAVGLLAYMIVILVIGMLADSVFSSASRRMRRSRGLAVD